MSEHLRPITPPARSDSPPHGPDRESQAHQWKINEDAQREWAAAGPTQITQHVATTLARMNHTQFETLMVIMQHPQGVQEQQIRESVSERRHVATALRRLFDQALIDGDNHTQTWRPNKTASSLLRQVLTGEANQVPPGPTYRPDPPSREPMLTAPRYGQDQLSADAAALHAHGHHEAPFDFFNEGVTPPPRQWRKMERFLGPRAAAAKEEIEHARLGRILVDRHGIGVIARRTMPAYAVSAGPGDLEVVIQLQTPPPWGADADLRTNDYLAHLTAATLVVDHGVATFSTITEDDTEGTFGHRITIGDLRLTTRAFASAPTTHYEGTWWAGTWQEVDDDLAPDLRGSRVTITTHLA